MSDLKSSLSALVPSVPSVKSLSWDALCASLLALTASAKKWAPKVVPPIAKLISNWSQVLRNLQTPRPVTLHPTEREILVSEFIKALSALTSSLQQGAPHLRGLETVFDDAAPILEAIVPGSASVVGAVQAVESATNAVIDTAQQTLTGAVTPAPVPANLAMAQELVTSVASAVQQSASTNGVVAAPVSTTVMTPAVPLVLATAVPSLPENAAPDLSATDGVDAAASNIGGVKSAASTPDAFAARLQTVESLLNMIVPMMADYAKQRGL